MNNTLVMQLLERRQGVYSQLHALQFRSETEEELGRSGSYLVS